MRKIDAIYAMKLDRLTEKVRRGLEETRKIAGL